MRRACQITLNDAGRLILERWSDGRSTQARLVSRSLGTNRSLVNRVWHANGLKPHLYRTFKVSNDPHFAEKLLDVVGLYLDPPEHALALGCSAVSGDPPGAGKSHASNQARSVSSDRRADHARPICEERT